MLLRIDRYVIKEVLQTFLGVMFVLFLIFMSNKLVRYLAEVASGELPGDVIFVMLALVSVRYLIMMIPLSLYIAVLVLLGRMYRDQEMAALASCGVGPARLYRPVFMVAIPLMIFSAWMTLYLVPHSASLEVKMLQQAQKKMEMTGISPGQFRESRDGKRTIYVESFSADRTEMKNVFIHLKWQDRPVMMSAEHARLIRGEASGEFLLELQNGTRYEGEPGAQEFRRISFAKHTVLIQQARSDVREAQTYAIPSETLMASSKPVDKAELQWRISVPISIMVLSLLAVPLAKIKPRHGQYGKLFVALLYYIVYVNLLAVGKTWVAKGLVPVFVGVWWIHALALLIAFIILIRQTGFAWVFARFFNRQSTTA